jgi:hypothetical protein
MFLRLLFCLLSIVFENGYDLRKEKRSRMNIFFLSFNAKIAAEYHCDKHVVKMIIESAQLLYSAHWVLNPENLPEGAYKKAHANHPCAIWVRESLSNYRWLCELGWWLCKEYQYRYGDEKTHKTESHIWWLTENPPATLVDIGVTTIRLAMPDEYKCGNPVEAYRRYYKESKLETRNIVKYTRRDWPSFLKR